MIIIIIIIGLWRWNFDEHTSWDRDHLSVVSPWNNTKDSELFCFFLTKHCHKAESTLLHCPLKVIVASNKMRIPSTLLFPVYYGKNLIRPLKPIQSRLNCLNSHRGFLCKTEAIIKLMGMGSCWRPQHWSVFFCVFLGEIINAIIFFLNDTVGVLVSGWYTAL